MMTTVIVAFVVAILSVAITIYVLKKINKAKFDIYIEPSKGKSESD